MTLTGCQIGYLSKNGYRQLEILNSRKPIQEAKQDKNLSDEEKRKIILAQEAKTFAVEELGLKSNDNYSSYVKLEKPYVSWLVTASPKNKIQPKKWWFPIVGEFPYLGFFNEQDAIDEFEKLKSENWDVHRRGVSAFSTLGWFSDPILSSMLAYEDYDLVNTIIHETVHATLFIKNSADFNERMATFIGNTGALLFYEKKLGPDHPDLKKFKNELQDELLFAKFITAEIKDLEQWYSENTDKSLDEISKLRIEKFQKIKHNFIKNLKPKLTQLTYQRFLDADLNNALLSGYRTYLQDLSNFEILYAQLNNSIPKLVDTCRSFEKSKDPDAELKKVISLE